jgi:hypothetical protein
VELFYQPQEAILAEINPLTSYAPQRTTVEKRFDTSPACLQMKPNVLEGATLKGGVAVVVTEHPFLTGGENDLNGRRCFPHLQ